MAEWHRTVTPFMEQNRLLADHAQPVNLLVHGSMHDVEGQFETAEHYYVAALMQGPDTPAPYDALLNLYGNLLTQPEPFRAKEEIMGRMQDLEDLAAQRRLLVHAGSDTLDA